MPSVYVGTYSKYNRDSIGGAWLDLKDYGDKDEFMKACQELHADEYDPRVHVPELRRYTVSVHHRVLGQG